MDGDAVSINPERVLERGDDETGEHVVNPFGLNFCYNRSDDVRVYVDRPVKSRPGVTYDDGVYFDLPDRALVRVIRLLSDAAKHKGLL